MFQLPDSNDFKSIYNWLKNNMYNKQSIALACAVGLSEMRHRNGVNPLLKACSCGDFQLVKALIEGGCNRNVYDFWGINCLLYATIDGNLEIIQYLIQNGFDKQYRRNSDGCNAILLASIKGHLEVIKYLKSIGCDVNFKTNKNKNCVYLASENGHLETVKYLVSCGIDPNETR